MVPKSLLIAMFFAVCIDRSFEDPTIIDSFTDQQTLDAVINKGLTSGVLLILVTESIVKNAKDQNIINLIDKEIKDITILRVVVQRHVNKVTAKYLHHTKPQQPAYPFVVALNNNRLMQIIVHDYNLGVLKSLIQQASNPTNKNDYAPNCGNFTDDLRLEMQQHRALCDKNNEINRLRRQDANAKTTHTKKRKDSSSSSTSSKPNQGLTNKMTFDLNIALEDPFGELPAADSSTTQNVLEILSSRSSPSPNSKRRKK